MRTFLENRELRARIVDEVSAWAAAPSVVPQGSFLGQILFEVYTSGLSEVLSSPSFLSADDLKVVNGSS